MNGRARKRKNHDQENKPVRRVPVVLVGNPKLPALQRPPWPGQRCLRKNMTGKANRVLMKATTLMLDSWRVGCR